MANFLYLIYIHQNDAQLMQFITRRYTCLLDSFVCRAYICTRLRILWNLIMVRSPVSHPANAPTNAVLKVHLRDASIRTIFEHNLGKIADRVSAQGRATPPLCHAVSPIFCTPAKKKKQSRKISILLAKSKKSPACKN